ncbi:hypothetical protein ES702_03689 [subsurface metagenome]
MSLIDHGENAYRYILFEMHLLRPASNRKRIHLKVDRRLSNFNANESPATVTAVALLRIR